MKKHLLILLFIMIVITGSLNAQEESSSSIFSLSRFRFEIYAMPHWVRSPSPEFPEHTRDHTKVLGYGLCNGLQMEYTFSARSTLRIGILLSEEWGTYQLVPEIPQVSTSLVWGKSYFLKRNEYYLQLPFQYKYSFTDRIIKRKLNPYVTAGLSFVYICGSKSIYLNNGGGTINHSETDNTFSRMSPYILMAAGGDCSIAEHLGLYAELNYTILKESDYLGYYYLNPAFDYRINYFGIGIGIKYSL